jgi:hypothetical protein
MTWATTPGGRSRRSCRSRSTPSFRSTCSIRTRPRTRPCADRSRTRWRRARWRGDERLDRIDLYTLDDVYGDRGYDEKRSLLTETYGQSLESIRDEIKADERSLALYRGITRFMVEDSLGPGYTGTKSALLRDSRRRAYGVIQRSRTWSNLIDAQIRASVRLSIHPQGCGVAKFGIRLLKIDDGWLTPWHAVAVQKGDRVLLMKRHAAEEIGQLVNVAGRAQPLRCLGAGPATAPAPARGTGRVSRIPTMGRLANTSTGTRPSRPYRTRLTPALNTFPDFSSA